MRMKEWPGMAPLPVLETASFFGEWRIVKTTDAFTLDREIHAAGWNFFFMAEEVKTTFLGGLAHEKIQSALKRIVATLKSQRFNGLEVTAINARHFLGVPYVTVSAHSRHMQQSCNIDRSEARGNSKTTRPWSEDSLFRTG